MARAETKIMEGAAPFLQDGEDVKAALVARPRGWTQANASAGGGLVAGMVGGAIGGKKQQENVEAANSAGFELPNPAALAVTQRRLLAFSISAPIGMGIGGNVKELAAAVPLSDVEDIEVKRLAAGRTITLTIRGTAFKLECGAGANAKGLAEAFEQAKAAV